MSLHSLTASAPSPTGALASKDAMTQAAQPTEATRVDLITSIERRVEHLPDWEGLTPDDALKLLDDIDGIKRRAAAAEEVLKAFLVTAMPERGWKELRIGTKHWWVGPKKRPPKCRNVQRCIESMYTVTGGDFEAVCSALGSNAIKYGEARKILGKAFDEHFDTTTKDELLSEDEGPVLNVMDDKFIR